MKNCTRLASAAGLVLSLGGAASAGTYTVEALSEKGTFTGCVMADEALGLGLVFVSSPSTAVLLAQSKSFGIVAGDEVSGSWSIDGGKATDFTSKSTDKDIANIQLGSSDTLTPLTAGKQLEVSVKGKKVQYDLAGFPAGAKSLAECMKTKKTP